MNELHLAPVGGLFDEFYNPSLGDLRIEPLQSQLWRANGLFWGQLLQRNSIEDVISLMQSKYEYTECDIFQYEAILADPHLFLERADLAVNEVLNQGISSKKFFAHVETLSIICMLYSEFKFFPHTLTVADGFLLNDHSSKQIIEDCLIPGKNPYLTFLQNECFPVISDNQSDIVWIHGALHISTIAMASYAKKLKPDVKIFVVDHSSEYYSLTKISRFLKKNKLLFSLIDVIDLSETKNNRELLKDAVLKKRNFSDIDNILYIDRYSGNIIEKRRVPEYASPFSDLVQSRPRSFPSDRADIIDPSEFVNAKLFPEIICPWRKCTFCGINQKYHAIDQRSPVESLESKVAHIAELVQQGKKYFWFYDEAIPPAKLDQFAELLLEKRLPITWHTRSRISSEFDKELCNKLSKSGLREIRIGLESASLEVLHQMNKFDSDFDLALVETLVSNFHSAGISVHFPIIIGFPGETEVQRHETYAFLRKLKFQYPSMSFNINTLELDVSSDLYKNFEEYDITTVQLPCLPKYYLGNTANWADERGWFDQSGLREEQSIIMRELLYPWLPETFLTKPNILYRLSETIRNTLSWKVNADQDTWMDTELDVTENTILQLSPWVVSKITPLFTSYYNMMYNISYKAPSGWISEFISLFSSPSRLSDAVEAICKTHALPDSIREECFDFAIQLYQLDFLVNEV